jgi:hypothetical protein
MSFSIVIVIVLILTDHMVMSNDIMLFKAISNQISNFKPDQYIDALVGEGKVIINRIRTYRETTGAKLSAHRLIYSTTEEEPYLHHLFSRRSVH